MKTNKKTSGLGALSGWKKGIRYNYGYFNIFKLGGEHNLIYHIWIDPVNTKAKDNRKTQMDLSKPGNVRYVATIVFQRTSYAIKRNIKTRMEAKAILESVKARIDELNGSKNEVTKIRELLIQLSRKS